MTRQPPITIRRSVHWLLDHPPKPNPSSNSECNLILDATWFGRKYCLIVYWDKMLQKAQWWRYSNKKEAANEIIADLKDLRRADVVLSSATSDGAPGIRAALDYLYPHIPHQRCLVHLQRMALAFLTQKPKTLAGWQLRNTVVKVNKIKSHQQHYLWQKDFYHWCNKYHLFLKEKSYSFEKRNWWYTHRSLRRVRRMIINALPDMWHYLDNPKISKDTNGLEGRWSSLKTHHRQHRGLSMKRKAAYFSWYLTIVVNKEKPTRFDH